MLWNGWSKNPTSWKWHMQKWKLCFCHSLNFSLVRILHLKLYILKICYISSDKWLVLLSSKSHCSHWKFITSFTALWKHDFGFNEFWLHHLIRILECFDMRYISDISYARIMRYGNPDTHFLRKFWIFSDVIDIWVKIHNKTMF